MKRDPHHRTWFFLQWLLVLLAVLAALWTTGILRSAAAFTLVQ